MLMGERHYKDRNECDFKFRSASTSSTFCYTRRSSEERCFKRNITVDDFATGDIFSAERKSECPSRITFTGKEDGESSPDTNFSASVDLLAIICLLGAFVLVLTLIAGIQFRR